VKSLQNNHAFTALMLLLTIRNGIWCIKTASAVYF